MLFSKNKKNDFKNPRSSPENRPLPATPIFVQSATASGSVLTLTFDQQVMLDGTPAFTTDIAAATPVSAVRTNPTTVAVTFSQSIAAAAELNISFQDRAIRNERGGFVYSPTFKLAA